MGTKTQPANFIVVREDIDGERVAGRFSNDLAAQAHAAKTVEGAPGSTASVYERKAVFRSRIVVEDDLPKCGSVGIS